VFTRTPASAGEFAANEIADGLDRIEVRWNHLVRHDAELELLFQEEDQLVDAGGVDDPAADQ
jgi:hypothetical protein